MKSTVCKKVIGVLILMFAILYLPSCTSRVDSKIYFEDYSEVYLITHDSDKEYRHRLPEDDAKTVCEIFGSADLLDDCFKCIFDTEFIIGAQTWHYSSENGTCNNYDLRKCFQVSTAEREQLKSLIEKYQLNNE